MLTRKLQASTLAKKDILRRVVSLGMLGVAQQVRLGSTE
jgi:hypothetical protein